MLILSMMKLARRVAMKFRIGSSTPFVRLCGLGQNLSLSQTRSIYNPSVRLQNVEFVMTVKLVFFIGEGCKL